MRNPHVFSYSTGDEQVFFSAGLTSCDASCPPFPNGTVVVFDRVFSNVGFDYHQLTGVFTCRVPGYYKFDLHMTNINNHEAALAITHNDQYVVDAFVQNSTKVEEASNSVIIPLLQGDTVKVTSLIEESYIFSTAEFTQTTFSGQLISATITEN